MQALRPSRKELCVLDLFKEGTVVYLPIFHLRERFGLFITFA